MYFYCLYYYKQAQQLKPNDSRMIIALGETYEKLEKTENALKCYYKACTVGDIEGQALIKLAKLYDKLKEFDNAAAAFTEYCLREDENRARFNEDQSEFYSAFQYLANYHLKKGQLDDAYTYAYKCMENEKVIYVLLPVYKLFTKFEKFSFLTRRTVTGVTTHDKLKYPNRIYVLTCSSLNIVCK
jgi:anaphase-promoting complex subunit 8